MENYSPKILYSYKIISKLWAVSKKFILIEIENVNIAKILTEHVAWYIKHVGLRLNLRCFAATLKYFLKIYSISFLFVAIPRTSIKTSGLVLLICVFEINIFHECDTFKLKFFTWFFISRLKKKKKNGARFSNSWATYKVQFNLSFIGHLARFCKRNTAFELDNVAFTLSCKSVLLHRL